MCAVHVYTYMNASYMSNHLQYDKRVGSKIQLHALTAYNDTFFIQGINIVEYKQVIIAAAPWTLSRTKHIVKLQPDLTILNLMRLRPAALPPALHTENERMKGEGCTVSKLTGHGKHRSILFLAHTHQVSLPVLNGRNC